MDQVEQEIRTLRSMFWSDQDPEGRAFAPLADAYRRAGQFREAVELLTDGRARHPDFATGHAVAALLYFERGLTTEGELAARRVLELDEENVLALRLLGDALAANGKEEEAAALRERLYALEPPVPVEAEEPAEDQDEVVLDIAALAPDEPVMDPGALAPDGPATAAGEEPAVGEFQAAEDQDEVVLDIAALAPEEPAEALVVEEPAAEEPREEDEVILDIVSLAPEEPAADGPEVEGMQENAPETMQPESTEDGPLVTRTMADLYARQGFTERALAVYRELLEISPDDTALEERIHSLETSLRQEEETTAGAEEDGVSEHPWHAQTHARSHEVDTPFAWAEEPEQSPPVGPPISEYFGRLLSWGAEDEAVTVQEPDEGIDEGAGGDGEEDDVADRPGSA